MGKSKIETIKEEHKLSANRATGSGQKVESFKYTGFEQNHVILNFFFVLFCFASDRGRNIYLP